MENKALNTKTIEQLQKFFIENKDPQDIEDEKLKEEYSKMMLDVEYSMNIMSIIINKIDILQLENLIKDGINFDSIIKESDRIELKTGNLYYVIHLPINNPDMALQLQKYIHSLLKDKTK